jgi:parallel beta-helix repeat protein
LEPRRFTLTGTVLVAMVGLASPAVRSVQLPEVTPVAGMVIDHSVRVRPGTYRLASVGLDAPALTIRGTDVTVDLTGVTLEGGDPLADPDGYTGAGVVVDAASAVTVRGATIRGYKVAILARRSPHLHLTGNDLSYNWKPRLWSGIEHESLVDWLDYHDNEHDEWLRYGAAIYLAACDDAQIDHNRAVQEQNGLLVTRSARLKVWNNTFSWMSGLGMGLYRTTDSVIEGNQFDWDVRGYSHGFYNRGQDSAALLMYEQSSGNTVAYNSATHGGDGLFLWAGQSTMDTGQGGANDNLFDANDFSHAVANGIEATFSRNRFTRNRLDDCWHGVWAGYSYDSAFIGNELSNNGDGLAIEHGQNITIADNRFSGDDTGIRLWANPNVDPSWGYGKVRDVRSRDYVITGNTFTREKTAINVQQTNGVRADGNQYMGVGTPLVTGAGVQGLIFEPPGAATPATSASAASPLPGVAARLPDASDRRRDDIIVDEWGPYDFLSPKLWPAGRPGDRPLRLRVLGPPGTWTLASIRGGTAAAQRGRVPGELTITPSGSGTDVAVTLTYRGKAVVTPRGVHDAADEPVAFSYSQVDPAIDWAVRYWALTPAADPVTAPQAFAAALKTVPVLTERLRHLDIETSGRLRPQLPHDHVALRAEGTVTLPTGRFELSVISDDGVRVWIDDRLAVDHWSVHESAVDQVPIAPGRHRLRVEYFQATGWAELQLRFRRIGV